MLELPIKKYSNEIREVDFGNIKIGGENALNFMNNENTSSNNKPLVAIQILVKLPKNYPILLKEFWGTCINNPVSWAKEATKINADLMTVKFNIEETQNIQEEIKSSVEILNEIQNITNKPLLIIGSNRKEIDALLLPELAKILKEHSTIGLAEEASYKPIIEAITNKKINIIARTPIDINLAKELNILITEAGIEANRIIIDPNMGSLGYGLDYAYSVIERIKDAALGGDNMLNMPIIGFVGEEAWKVKESKATIVPDEWGNNKNRALLFETMTATATLLAGANIVSLYHPESVKKIKEFIEKAY